MNPNNNNLEYLLKLPTSRLLNLYRKTRGQVSLLDERDWSLYETHKEALQRIPKGEKLPKHICHPKSGRYLVNELYWAREVEKLLELKTALKKELDTREHLPRTKR